MAMQALPVAAMRLHPVECTTATAPCCLLVLILVHMLPQIFHEMIRQADLWRNDIRRPASVAGSMPA